jgi:hypothetical protein
MRAFEVQSVEAMGRSGEKICKHSPPPTRHNTERFGPDPKASKVWKFFLQSSKAYSKAFLSLKPVKALGLRANTGTFREQNSYIAEY